MGIALPKLGPNPGGASLAGKSVVVTGGNAGLGLEATRQLLQLGPAVLIIACRTVSKGEDAKPELLATANRTTTEIRVMQLDMEDPRSIVAFASATRKQLSALDILILNAGIGYTGKFETGPTGHERTMQTNAYSNVLLALELLPLLEAGPSPSRITWVGSRRMADDTQFRKQTPQPALAWLDDPKAFIARERYTDSKLVALMCMYELAACLDQSKVVLNMMCPGMTKTNFFSGVPFPLSLIISALWALRAREVEVGGWIVLHSAVYAGPETHGQFNLDRDVKP